jgi:uncharacterized membrane protein
MKFISRKTHAIMDYIMGVILIVAPWLLGFADNEQATWSAVAVGILMLAMSLITDYEGGLIKAVPMAVHLGMDVFAGLFLAISPWLLGFHSEVFLPHLVLGILEIGAALSTDRTSLHSASGRVNVSHDFR